jgi:hypothetical protein
MTTFENDWGTMPEEHKEKAGRAFLLTNEIMKTVIRHPEDDGEVLAHALMHALANVLLSCPDASAIARQYAEVLVKMVDINAARRVKQ